MGVPEILIVLCVFAIVVVGTGFWIWMIVDCATKEAEVGNTKIVWILILIFTHFSGALVYFLVRRPQRQAELGR